MIMNGVGSGTTGNVDRKNQEKLYIQVMRILVDEIGKGTWAIGDRIPSEGELSARYAVSKITIRQALTNLTSDGYLIRVGEGAVAPEETRSILESRTRTARVPTAPPQGLFLWNVIY